MIFWKKLAAIAALGFACLTLQEGRQSVAQLFSGAPTVCWNVGSDGWTVLCPTEGTGTCNASATGTHTGTCYIAVSESGDDGTCTAATTQAAAELAPCLTLAEGLSQVRNNSADWLLLKKGDTWTDEQFGYLCVSGKSQNSPILISSYGTGARPLLKTSSTTPAVGSFGGCEGGRFIAVVGLEFYAYKRDPDSPDYVPGDEAEYLGTRFLNATPWTLIEDCKISFYQTNVSYNVLTYVGAGALIFRRNVILNAYSITDAHTQGIGAVNRVSYLLLEENLFSNNGWNATIGAAVRTIFDRNVYLAVTTVNVVARGNISTYSSAEGYQFRTGGVIYNNLSVQNSNGFDLGHQQSDSGVPTSGSVVTYNVIQESNDIDASNPRGQGISVLYASSNEIRYNIVVNSDADIVTNVRAILFDAQSDNNTVEDNVFCNLQGRPVVSDSGSGNVLTDNILNEGTSDTCDGLGFADPTRTVGTYNAQIPGCASLPGGCTATLDAFLTSAQAQSKDNWNPYLQACAVNDWIRAGFNLAEQGCPYN